MTKVLITGATGFLGRAISQKYLDNNYEVTAIVRNPDKILDQRIKVYKINFENLLELNAIISNNKLIDANTTVIHCAAVLGAAQASKKTYKKINVNASLALFDVANQLKAKKFVFISSMGAAGPIGSLEEPITEEMTGEPRAYYSRSKFEAEQTMINYPQRSIPLVIIRPPVIYGPGMNPRSGAALLFNGCKRRIFGIIGRGKNSINLVYIDNLVEGIVVCADSVDIGYEIFFLADGEPYQIMQILDEIKSELRTNTKIIKFPYLLLLPIAWLTEMFGKLIRRDIGFNVELVRGMATHAYLFSIDKAKSAGYDPNISLEEGIKRTVEYLSR
ncbi:MAG: NAD-dependent epimerase/dehydratase family protein [Candidatus Kariarchaeaceae archaeon]|jgi:nucleoside-diphosphate-sugar epimerase